METSNSRRKWGKEQEVQMPINARAVREEIFPHHEEYLLLLQEKNRLIKKLRKKNRSQINLEQKEQGFALYVNGANADRDPPTAPSTSKNSSKTKLPKTAETRRNIYLTPCDLSELEADERRRHQRSQTAPTKSRRKGWNMESVDITTAGGDKHKISAPANMTGRYEDDFEVDDSGDYHSDDDDNDREQYFLADSDSDIEVDASGQSYGGSRPGSARKTSYLKKKVAQIREEEKKNRLTLTLADVRKLRQSLEMNASIRQSLAMDASSGLLPPLSHNPYRAPQEHVDMGLEKGEEDIDHGSPIEELDEEIEEDLSPDGSTDCPTSPITNVMKPNETIVLEFAPLPRKGKVDKNLTAARKKDVDSSSFLKPRPLPHPEASPRGTSPSTPRAVTPSKKSLRPLSASRKNADDRLDSQQETAAVMKALKEENARTQNTSRDVTRSPRPELRPSSGNPQPSKSRQSSRGPADSLDPTQLSESLSQGQVSSIVSKVLVMPCKQQRRLLKMLGKLDGDLTSASVQHKHSKTSSSNQRSHGGQGQLDVMEVNMEILSNWGHRDRVGLTEIQFMDRSNRIIPVRASDVSVHGAAGSKTSLDVLFNGRPKTTKERYMWSCEYEDGLSVEFVITLHNPTPSKIFQVSAIKVYNFNKSLNDLNIGARHTRIFLGGELVFDGDLDKGCGNQAFDYCTVIDLANSGIDNSVRDHISKGDNSVNGLNRPSGSHSSPSPSGTRPLPSPSGSRVLPSPSGSRPLPSPSGSRPLPSPSGHREKEGKHHIRSETRTLHHHSDVDGRIRTPGTDRSESSPENEDGGLHLPEKSQSKTPRKRKRLAARLDGHSSETDTSRSMTDSLDKKAALAPIKKSSDKSPTHQPSPKPRSLASLGPSRGGHAPSPSTQQAVGEDDANTPMLQKLKDMNISDPPAQEAGDLRPRRPGWLHTMLQQSDQSDLENKKKKDVPMWLNAEEGQDRPSSGSVHGSSPSPRTLTPRTLPSEDKNKSRQDDAEPLVVEDLGSWPHAGLDHLQTVLDKGKQPSPRRPQSGTGEMGDELTPMTRIEANRAKWRTSHGDLEEEWGSLTMFNTHQRGRLSMDMTDGEFDEHMNPSKKTGVQEHDPMSDDAVAEEDDNFVIPELPYGSELTMNIRSTWGDKHYVGLTGIDIFSSKGEPVIIKEITSKPRDINELPEYHKDPRVITNIIDGISRTRDDIHMWLAPFTSGGDHMVFMTFEKPCKIAMIRIWNYNKSRIHSYRGAKDIVLQLDRQVIFKGEIARACGGVEGGTEAFGDTILFTMDENILEEVSKNDDAYDRDMFSDEEEDLPFERPRTADDEDRPFTRAAGVLLKKSAEPSPRPDTSLVTSVGDVIVYKTRKLELDFTETWGDMHYLGVTGIEIAGKDGEPLPLKMSMMSANPRDLHCLADHEYDDRTLDKVIDGQNITMSDEHMWLVPFTAGQSHTLTIDFDHQVLVSAVRIWNYNKSVEDTYRGAKVMHVRINGKQVSPAEGYLIRKGPGTCHFDFAQEISLSSMHKPQNSYPQKISSQFQESYEVVQMPCGFIYQLQLISTWGDQYYIGLNGIEIYDSCFNLIELTNNNISAFPESCNVLDTITNDIRTPDKLIDGVNDSSDGKHMWLAPVLPTLVNRVYIIFDQPTTVSMIRLWNYSKTPTRGVKDFALLVDDLLVYNGNLPSVTTGARGILPTCAGSQRHHSVLFTDNKEILKREKNSIISNHSEDQDIQLLNDKQIVSKYSNPKSATSGKPVNQALRPKTSVPIKRR